MARITACLIAKDEAELLPGCLASIHGAVDEIVLVDTGSTDRTRELARDAGARVLDRPWDDDFAAPRNLAAAHATGDWILQLDADERLGPGAGKALRRAVKKAPFDVGFLPLHNAVAKDAPLAAVVSGARRIDEPAHLPRLLRRTPDLRWEGVIHESVLEWAVARGYRIAHVAADLVHLGYEPALFQGRAKRERNLRLLRKRVALEPDNAVPLGYLATELLELGDLAGAHEVAERAWAMLPGQPAHRAIRRLAVARAVLAVRAGDPRRIRESVDRAEAKEGPNPDYPFLRACAAELEASAEAPGSAGRRARLEDALSCYRATMAALLRGGFEQVMKAGEWEASARSGAVLLALGRVGEAHEAFARARAAGGGTRVQVAEAEALLAAGDPAGALRTVETALGAEPGPWALAARAAHALGAVKDAELFLAQAKARLASAGAAR